MTSHETSEPILPKIKKETGILNEPHYMQKNEDNLQKEYES